jgi:uncharacterized protein (DUF1778 family)
MIEGIGSPTEPKNTNIEVDVIRKCWENSTGSCIEVRPDCDGLNLVEIAETIDGETRTSFALSAEMATAVAMAILDCADEMTARESEAE